ncbi:MAG: 2-oxoacid:acceptor oxidoreductase family protein [Tissierellia bacterium]|nr:2-oxoacid:acceptor oxidoreductase family protein [Tissierellia bacterium]
MWELKFYSRGGQGAVTSAKYLIAAAIKDSKFGQAIPSYGQERKGAPVFTFARIDDSNIEVKSYVYSPNCVICYDSGLPELGIDITEGISGEKILVINSDSPIKAKEFEKIYYVDASTITRELLGENVPPNMAMLGALIKATNCVDLESLIDVIKDKIPGEEGEINAKACRKAYELTKKL